jgi:hypothetical protein
MSRRAVVWVTNTSDRHDHAVEYTVFSQRSSSGVFRALCGCQITASTRTAVGECMACSLVHQSSR